MSHRTLSAPLFIMSAAVTLTSPAFAQSTTESTAPAVTRAEQTPRVLYSSTLWAEESGAVIGMWRIEDRAGDERVLVLGVDFKAKSGPELQILLSPKNAEQISHKNALDEAFVLTKMVQETFEANRQHPTTCPCSGDTLRREQLPSVAPASIGTCGLSATKHRKLWDTS